MRSFMLSTTLVAAMVFLSSGTSSFAQKKMKEDIPKEPEKKRSSAIVGGKTMQEWLDETKSSDASIRERAIAALKVYGRDARYAVKEVIKALREPDVSVRVNAVISLGFIGLDEKDREVGVRAIASLLRDDQKIVRYQAAVALGKLGPDAKEAIPQLAAVLQDRSTWEVRRAAAAALGSLGIDAQGVNKQAMVSLIKDGLLDPCMEVRLESIYSLIWLGIPGDAVWKATEEKYLETMIANRGRSPQPDKIAIWARVALMRIGKVSETHLVAIAKFLKSKKLDSRVHAARALGAIGPSAGSRADDLVQALDDKEPEVLVWSSNALGNLRQHSKDAVPKLTQLTSHADPLVKIAAQEAIDMIKEAKDVPVEKNMDKKKKK
jgi:HEAT repeat protein